MLRFSSETVQTDGSAEGSSGTSSSTEGAGEGVSSTSSGSAAESKRSRFTSFPALEPSPGLPLLLDPGLPDRGVHRLDGHGCRGVSEELHPV